MPSQQIQLKHGDRWLQGPGKASGGVFNLPGDVCGSLQALALPCSASGRHPGLHGAEPHHGGGGSALPLPPAAGGERGQGQRNASLPVVWSLQRYQGIFLTPGHGSKRGGMGAEAGVSCLSSSSLWHSKQSHWALSSLPGSLVPRAWQGSDVPSPGRSPQAVLVGCSCCVFILQESDSATALKVTPEGCDRELGHGHREELLAPRPAAGKGWSKAVLPAPPALTGRAPRGHFSNRIN